MTEPPPQPAQQAQPARRFSTAGPPTRRLLRGVEQLQHLVGAIVLVGISQRDPSGTIVSRRQFHGPVTEVTDGVVVVRHADGDVLLPAEPDAFTPARPGRYTLPSGEVVVDPDYVTTWSVTPEG